MPREVDVSTSSGFLGGLLWYGIVPPLGCVGLRVLEMGLLLGVAIGLVVAAGAQPLVWQSDWGAARACSKMHHCWAFDNGDC